MTPEEVTQLVLSILARQSQRPSSGASVVKLRRLETLVRTHIPFGSMAMTGNLTGVETVNPGAGTFVRVGAGNGGTHPLFVANPNNDKFAFDGTTAPTQELRYTGNSPFKLCIRAYLSLQDQAVGAEGFALRLLQAGVVVANTTVEGQTGGLITSSGFIATEGLVMADPGDVFTVEFANITSGANLTASSCIVTVGSAQ